MKDILGQTISIGDWVAYPTSAGHTPVMNVGEVKSLVREDIRGRRWENGEWIETPIEHWKIGIWSHGNTYWARKGRKAQRISYPNWQNVIKIPPPEALDGNHVSG